METLLTPYEILVQYLNLLWGYFLYDMSVYTDSSSWFYYWVIPITVYTIFFILKWAILTIPITGPLSALSYLIKRGK